MAGARSHRSPVSSVPVGNEVVRPDELWGVRVTMDFYRHSPDVVCRSLDVAGFSVEDIAESEPYPEVDTKVDARTSLDANAHSHRPRKVISQRTRMIIPVLFKPSSTSMITRCTRTMPLGSSLT